MSKIRRHEGGPGDGGSPAAAEITEDAAVVRSMYGALEEDDEQALAGCVDPRIEWIHPMVTRLPFDGARHGLPTVLRDAFRRAADGGEPRVSAETFLEFGDGVLVVGRLLGRSGMEGEPAEKPFLHECFVRGGKVIRIREYPVERESRRADRNG